MAYETKQVKTANFKIDLKDSEDEQITTSRTISFDIDDEVTAAQVATVASTFFAVGGMSNVFQPANWRDYQGVDTVYIMTAVTPSTTTRITTTGEPIKPSN